MIREHIHGWLQTIGTLPGGCFEERDGVTTVTTSIAWPMFNGVLAAPEATPAAVARGVEAMRGRSWFMWETEGVPAHAIDAAHAAGAQQLGGRDPWVRVAIADLPDPQLPEGVTIEEVAGEDGYRLWSRMMRTVYGFTDAGERAWAAPAELCGWRGLPWRQFLARRDGEPVGTAMLVECGGSAALYAVGTVSAARRRGIGAALTLVPLKSAPAAEAGFFASEDGLRLYEALGFAVDGWVARHGVGRGPTPLPPPAP